MRRVARMAAVGGVVALSVFASQRIARAIERKPLPPFSLEALDGRPVSSVDIVQPGKWLLLYVRPGCGPCDTLLETIDPKANPIVPTRALIVIGGVNAQAAAKLAAHFGDLKGAAWYADPTRAMESALPLAGAPVVFGMKENMLEWSIAGVVPSAAAMKSALRSWVEPAR
jgi:hypothetical protein